MTNFGVKILYGVSALGVMSVAFFYGVTTAQAAAWWGDGYRSPEWVVSNGGSIFNYRVVGGDLDDHKAMMFRGGQYVEVEFGQDATFDDAKDGWYEIVFYECDDSCTDHMYEKKTKIRDKDEVRARISLQARPGETVNLVFDAGAGRVFIASRYGYVPSKTPAQIAMERAEAVEGDGCAVRTPAADAMVAQERSHTLARFARDDDDVACL